MSKSRCRTKKCRARRRSGRGLGNIWSEMNAAFPYRIDIVSKGGVQEKQWEDGPRNRVTDKASKICGRPGVESVSVLEVATGKRGRMCP